MRHVTLPRRPEFCHHTVLIAATHFLSVADSLYREGQHVDVEQSVEMQEFRAEQKRQQERLDIKRLIVRKIRDEGEFDEELAKSLDLSPNAKRRYLKMAENCKARIQACKEREVKIIESLIEQQEIKESMHRHLARLIEGDRSEQEDELLKTDPPSMETVREFQLRGLIPDLEFNGVARALAAESDDMNRLEQEFNKARFVAAQLERTHPYEVSQKDIASVACWYLAQRDPAFGPLQYFKGFTETCRQLKEDKDPFLTRHGLVDRKKLPPRMGVLRLKGVGEFVVPEGWAANEAEIQDMWAAQRFQWATPAEVRASAGEQMQQQNMHGIARILGFLERATTKMFEARRPSEEDVEHCNPDKNEKPFEGTEAQLPDVSDQFLVTKDVAKLHNTVHPSYRLKAVKSREEIYNEFLLPFAQRKGWQLVTWQAIQKDAFVK